jgi:hypothetical protein
MIMITRFTNDFLNEYEDVMGYRLTWRNFIIGFIAFAALLVALAIGQIF